MRRSRQQDAQKKYDELKLAWDQHGNESLFVEKRQILEAKKIEYEQLHEKFQEQLNLVLEKIREERLTEFLKKTMIEPGIIDGIGPTLIEKLESHKIFSAANINRKKISNIPGFGQVREDRLIEWRDDLIDSFAFDPADALNPRDVAALRQPFDKKAEALEKLLQQGPTILKNCKVEILEYRQHALRPLCAAAEELRQAQVNLIVISA